MDQIINWLLLTIIFVFDPLAIALVVAANFAFDQLKKNVYGETVSKEKVFKVLDQKEVSKKPDESEPQPTKSKTRLRYRDIIGGKKT
jgi:hypothetical protein